MTQREQVLIKYKLDVLDKHIEEENCSQDPLIGNNEGVTESLRFQTPGTSPSSRAPTIRRSTWRRIFTYARSASVEMVGRAG
jgi:hypothetical protein